MKRLLLAVGVGCSLAAHAQDYPSKAINITVPNPPGGMNQIHAQPLSSVLEKLTKQPAPVINRPGGTAAVGTAYVANQPPDGHNILVTTPNLYLVIEKDKLYGIKTPFTLDQIALIALLSADPLIMTLHPALPVKNVKGLVALAKARPGELTYGTSGPGSMSHFAGEMFKRLAGVNMVTVNYKGNAQAITEIMGGQITSMFSDALPAVQALKTGKIRALAVTSAERWPHTPELPTLAEEGIKGFAAVNWWGILFPAGVPRPVVDKVNADLRKSLSQPGVRSALANLGVEAISSTPEEFRAFMESETDRWGKLIREAKLETQKKK